MFVSRVRRVNFNKHVWQIRILHVKFFEDCCYLELKTEDRMLQKQQKGEKDSIYMQVNIKYSLQDTSILQ